MSRDNGYFGFINEVPLFIEVRRVILEQDSSSIDHIVELSDELESFECKARNLRRLLFEFSYDKVINNLISPIDELFESEYSENK